MRKEKSDLEQLLNTLIQRGWKPFGKRNKLYAVEDGIYILGRIASDWNTYDLRQITSKESGLWQFVCENDLLNIKKEKKRITPEHLRVFNGEYQYRLIEASLTDEDKLEEFLLNSIKLD